MCSDSTRMEGNVLTWAGVWESSVKEGADEVAYSPTVRITNYAVSK